MSETPPPRPHPTRASRSGAPTTTPAAGATPAVHDEVHWMAVAIEILALTAAVVLAIVRDA